MGLRPSLFCEVDGFVSKKVLDILIQWARKSGEVLFRKILSAFFNQHIKIDDLNSQHFFLPIPVEDESNIFTRCFRNRMANVNWLVMLFSCVL